MGYWNGFVKAFPRPHRCEALILPCSGGTGNWPVAVSAGGPGLANSLVSGHVPHSSEDWEKSTNLNTVISGSASAKKNSSPAAGGPRLLRLQITDA